MTAALLLKIYNHLAILAALLLVVLILTALTGILGLLTGLLLSAALLLARLVLVALVLLSALVGVIRHCRSFRKWRYRHYINCGLCAVFLNICFYSCLSSTNAVI
jgi:hypothetical protein